MLHRILGKLSGQSPRERDFTQRWNERVKAQHDDLQKASFDPVPDETLAFSDAQYFDQSHRSMMFARLNLNNQSTVFPVRARLCDRRDTVNEFGSSRPRQPHPQHGKRLPVSNGRNGSRVELHAERFANIAGQHVPPKAGHLETMPRVAGRRICARPCFITAFTQPSRIGSFSQANSNTSSRFPCIQGSCACARTLRIVPNRKRRQRSIA